MKVIDNEIGANGYKYFYSIILNRLSRILVNNGFGDLKVKVGDKEIICVRSILMNGNETIRKLLLDEKQSEVLELYEKCEINSFLEIEKYYSGGVMKLNNDNICDILRFSIYYNDNRLMLVCKRYLQNVKNDLTMIETFSILDGLNINKLSDMKSVCENYIKQNGINYLNDDELLSKLNLDSIKLIFKSKKILIKNESWLLSRLLRWYREVFQVKEKEDEYEKEKNEFILLIKTKIYLNEIRIEELNEEDKQILDDLEISIDGYVNHHVYANVEVENKDIMKIINKFYTNEEEESELELNGNEIEELNKEEVKEEMIKLLSNEDIKLNIIMVKIIMKMNIAKIIPKEIKKDLLLKLIYEYKRCNSYSALKCFSLFVDNYDYIATMKCLCGKEVLYRILNNEKYLNSKSKELLIKYIQEMESNDNDDDDEEEETSKIILDEKILEELKTKEITSFSYPHSEYSFVLYEVISIIPSFDGTRCEFSISPPLPSGTKIDKENGMIYGKVEKEIEKKEYEITCKNLFNEKKFKISLEIDDIIFTELNNNRNITISNNGKIITNTNGYWNHCYLNLKMENGVYHFKYQFHQNGSEYDWIMLGLSTNNTFSGRDIQNQSTTCNYYACNDESQDINYYCNIGTVVTRNPNFNNHGDGSIYEIIVDMNKREFWISHNSSSPVLLVKDLPSPLYPYASLGCANTSIELLSVSHQN